MEKKREFIEALGDILRKYSRENVNYISYAAVNGQEYAQVIYMNGHRKQVNITGDSCAAILHDIYRVLKIFFFFFFFVAIILEVTAI